MARDPANGDLGVAVQSKFPNVRVAVPFAKAGVGAVATQSFANSDFGTKGLKLLELGATPQEVLAIIGRDDADLQDRQVGIVDARGRAATFTGKKCFDWAGGRTGPDYAIQGNILVSEATVDAMEKAFLASRAPLAQRLLAAIKAGAEAGGDKRGRQSAALLVVREGASYDGKSDAYVDISVYDAPDPIAEIFRLYELQKIHFERSDPADVVPITGEDARYLQRLLSKKGFHKGRTDGVWDDSVHRGARRLHGMGELRHAHPARRQDRPEDPRAHPGQGGRSPVTSIGRARRPGAPRAGARRRG